MTTVPSGEPTYEMDIYGETPIFLNGHPNLQEFASEKTSTSNANSPAIAIVIK